MKAKLKRLNIVLTTLFGTKQGTGRVECTEAIACDYATDAVWRLQEILHESAGFLLFTSYLFTLTSNGRIFWEVIGKKEEVRSEVAFRCGEKQFYYKG